MPYPLLDTVDNPYGPVVKFLIGGVQPPAQNYIGPSDQLQLTLMAPNVPATVTLGLRLLSLRGEVQPLSYTFTTPATAGGSFVEVIVPGECFLLSAVITGASVRRGQCWARLNLQRGNPTGGAAVGSVLIAGYATATDTIGFPGTPSTDSTEGKGASLVYTGAVPALATGPTLTVPPGTRWRITTGHNTILPFVQNGIWVMEIKTAGGAPKMLLGTIGQAAPIAPSAAETFMFSFPALDGAPLFMECNSGDVISVIDTGGIGALVQSSALSVNVEEFVEI